MIQCPNCGAQNQDGTLFCDQCLVDLAAVQPSMGGDAPSADASGSEVQPLESTGSMSMESSSMSMEASIEASEFSVEETMQVDAPPMDAPPLGDDLGLGFDVPQTTGTSGMPSGAPPASAVGLDMPPAPGTSGFVLSGESAPAPTGSTGTSGLEGLDMMPGSDLDVAMGTAPGTSPSQLGAPPMSPSKLGAPPVSPSKLGAGALPSPSQLAGAPPMSPSKLGMGAFPSPSQLGAPLSPSKLGAPAGPTPSQLAAAPPPLPSVPSQTVARLSPIAVAKLVVVRGLKTAVEYPVYEGQNFIGRFDEKPVDIDITEQEDSEKPRASRQHACIAWETTGLTIEDLSSSNGTFVNRVRVSPGEKKALRNGDYIQTGNVLFQIKV
ncbi:hypothetical protein AYO44_07085 [Planctomycetaceae bacterium SCGC AG-212-F19]|nr:hypothetical protein AYO44_07085 [Planctomycetaceae bacterium SCGC AG-212-F19]